MQPPRRSAAVAFGEINDGRELAPRRADPHAAPLSHLDQPSPPPRKQKPAGPARSPWWSGFSGGDDAQHWLCRACSERIQQDANNGASNLKSHYEKKHKRIHKAIVELEANQSAAEVLEDELRKDLAEKEVGLEKRAGLWNRFLAKPDLAQAEVWLLLYMTKRGIPYESVQDPLFAFFIQVCSYYYY